MTNPENKYPNLNNAVALGLELVVAQDNRQKLVRSILIPAGKGKVFRDLVQKEAYGGNGNSPLFTWLLGAQWFPIAVEHTLTDSLDAIEKRLNCLPSGFAFLDEGSKDEKDINLWRKSIENICAKLESATLPQISITDVYLKDLFYRVPTDFPKLIKAGGFN